MGAAPVLLRQLLEAQTEERGQVAWALASVNSRRANAKLVRWLTRHPDPAVRADAATALILAADNGQDIRLAEVFLSVLDNPTEQDDTRAHVIEGLACLLARPCVTRPLETDERHKDRRSRFWRRCTAAILPYLDHPNPRFRWEAAFALGQARCRQALPRLWDIAVHDQGLSDGDHGIPVAVEAAEAIESILTRR